VTIGGVLGLVAGKPLGIVGGTWLVTRFTRAELDESVAWADIVGVGLLAGIGFTVSLLVAELSFPNQPLVTDHAKLGVLAASLMASLLAAVVLTVRNRRYRALEEEAVLSSAS
jgi:NhaA family Na+:H+ antiporter